MKHFVTIDPKNNCTHLLISKPIYFAIFTLGLFFGIFTIQVQAQNKLAAIPYGGQRQLKEFIKQEMQYPELAYSQNIQGDVTISIYIDKSGNVTDMKILDPMNVELDAETRRILSMVLWQAATNLGIPVEDIQPVTIKYNIKKYDRYCKERGYREMTNPRLPIDSTMAIYNFDAVDSIPVLLFEEKSLTLSKFINQNIEYPETAMEHNISGTETVEFIVEPSGRISNIVPKAHIGGGCCEEAMRLVKLLKWHPGIKDDQAVRTWVNINITFNLTNDGDTRYVPTNMSGSMQ